MIYYVILLVIPFNNILQSLPIVLTNYPIFLISQISSIYYWKLSFLYYIIRNYTSRYLIYWKAYNLLFYLLRLIFPFFLSFLPYNYWAVGSKIATGYLRPFLDQTFSQN